MAASSTLGSPDANSRIVVENAMVEGNRTKLLLWTYPEVGDPQAGKPCALNFYTLLLQPGLPATEAVPAARAVCGTALARGRLLDGGDLLIVGSGRLERWRAGKRISSHSPAALQAAAGTGVAAVHGGLFFDLAASGDSVFVLAAGGATQRGSGGSGTVVVGLDGDGAQRWRYAVEVPGKLVTALGVWASNDGGALVRLSMPAGLSAPEQLYTVDRTGRQRGVVEAARDDLPDMEAIMKAAQADPQAAMALLTATRPESVERLDAAARAGGGFDVLLYRKGGAAGREGHFLLRIGSAGELDAEYPLNETIVANGLERWSDFRLDGDTLYLLSRVDATQPAVTARRTTYPQNVISRIELSAGTHSSWLVPLDVRYLEAAMNAGDEQIQYLSDWPGGQPVSITMLGGKPLAISAGWLSRKAALRFDTVSEDWLAYTEAADRRSGLAAKQSSRQQRNAAREARALQMNAALAASVGMTPEEFAALSNRERKEAMVRAGDIDAMTAAAAMQAQTATAADPRVAAGPRIPDDKALKVNANLQGFVEFENTDGAPVSLSIYDRRTGAELFGKTYDDGVIYEYVDFSQFDRPLEQIGVAYRGANDSVLKDLTPVIEP
jgi:hypothetical protein